MDTPCLSSIFIVCQNLDDSTSFYQRLGLDLNKRSQRTSVFRLNQATELHLHEELSDLETENYGVRWSKASEGLVLSFDTHDLRHLISNLGDQHLQCQPTVTPWGSRIAILKDPDGYLLEVREVISLR